MATSCTVALPLMSWITHAQRCVTATLTIDISTIGSIAVGNVGDSPPYPMQRADATCIVSLHVCLVMGNLGAAGLKPMGHYVNGAVTLHRHSTI